VVIIQLDQINNMELTSEEFEAAYTKHVLDEVTHNTMTRGEFHKKLETDKEFYSRFFPDYTENTFDWSYNNDIEIK
jgi:hypothetical protein